MMKTFQHKKNESLPTKKVAIVVPMHKPIGKEELSREEKISMRHLLHFLDHYDKYFAAPEGLKINYPGFKIKRFSKKYFKSLKGYSRLLLSENFYQQFSDYQYILIYQLDSLVFSDQLLYWCNQDYDYIGAPWFRDVMSERLQGTYKLPDSCGNGGFSLRNIRNCIKVIRNSKKPLFRIIKEVMVSEISLIRKKEKRIKEYLKALKAVWVSSAAHRYPDKSLAFHSDKTRGFYEDWFWSFEARKYYPDLRIPSADIGVRFSFEMGPRYCFEKNNRKLPFGCHAWAKWDKNFWLSYLIKEDKEI